MTMNKSLRARLLAPAGTVAPVCCSPLPPSVSPAAVLARRSGRSRRKLGDGRCASASPNRGDQRARELDLRIAASGAGLSPASARKRSTSSAATAERVTTPPDWQSRCRAAAPTMSPRCGRSPICASWFAMPASPKQKSRYARIAPGARRTLRLHVVRTLCRRGAGIGAWPDNLASDRRNLPYANFGCASQRNLAVQVANPADLVGPRTMSPAAAERRDTVYEKYVSGKITHADKSNDERLQVKGSR